MTNHFLTGIALGVALAFSTVAFGQDSVDTNSGIFTAEQAESGAKTYMQLCSVCHGDSLGGGASSPPLKDFAFTSYWAGKPLVELYDYLESMPADNPGSMSEDQQVSVLAHMLSVNGFPAGEVPLTTDAEILATINFAAPK